MNISDKFTQNHLKTTLIYPKTSKKAKNSPKKIKTNLPKTATLPV